MLAVTTGNKTSYIKVGIVTSLHHKNVNFSKRHSPLLLNDCTLRGFITWKQPVKSPIPQKYIPKYISSIIYIEQRYLFKQFLNKG